MIIETRISVILGEDREKQERGEITEIIPFPTKAVIDVDRGIFFWEETDMTTVMEVAGNTINVLENYEDFKKKYLNEH